MTKWSKIVSVLKKILSLISFIDKIYALANFVNLAVFIKQGTINLIKENIAQSHNEFYQCRCNLSIHKIHVCSISL